MLISGIKGTSLIDYPGKIAMVIYTSKCNFRCPFCHNGELAAGQTDSGISIRDVIEEAEKRRGFIDAVVITGGEPTLNSDLIDLLIKLKESGLLIKLDTNGSRPEVIRKLIAEECVDYIAMDIKTSWNKYSLAAGVKVETGRLAASVDLIKSGNTDYEFRTTCVPGLVEEDDIKAISRIAGERSKYTLQQFSNENTLDPE